jgi:hypothetical protein
VICKVDGCSRTHQARGFCSTHYESWRLGDLSEVALRICAVVACDRRVRARGLCASHYTRWRITGDAGDKPSIPQAQKGNTYTVTHDRLYRVKGKASAHLCLECGATAADWAYDHQCPDERIGDDGHGKLLAYSLDPAHYVALCRSCHSRFDHEWHSSQSVA